MNDQVRSKDGTSIAYDRTGIGPAVILVGGAADDRTENAPIAPVLAERGFTVLNYDRRGRGLSGDTRPYALEREIEDLEALIAEAGGSAYLFGVSSGGALALEAAAAGLPIGGLAVYEVPYDMADDAPRRHREYVETLESLLGDGRRGDAFAHFMRMAGAPESDIAGARRSSLWPRLEDLAHTLVHDAACLGDGRPPAARLAAIEQPVLVVTGGGAEYFERAADAIAAGVPGAERRTLEGQGHVVDPNVIVPVLERFYEK